MFSSRCFLVGDSGCIADTLRFRSDSVLNLTRAGQSLMSHVGLDPQKPPLVASMEENAELQHDNAQCIHRLPFPRTNYPSND
ncbi:hypothetical protein ARMGADRAFT_1009050 [Armillaria gallica]|uniref:Uncharacterized protein n=1 Tax=Armillaria gallica TaxID=47427 RepID=A0A2H3E685_ARMGA|nr:hypothetical protein ARMGADRAFT_1009050 [Armillaria gallica]